MHLVIVKLPVHTNGLNKTTNSIKGEMGSRVHKKFQILPQILDGYPNAMLVTVLFQCF